MHDAACNAGATGDIVWTKYAIGTVSDQSGFSELPHGSLDLFVTLEGVAMHSVAPRWFGVAWAALVTYGSVASLLASDLKPVSYFSVYSWLAVVLARGSLLKFIMFFVWYYAGVAVIHSATFPNMPREIMFLLRDVTVPAIASIADDVVMLVIRQRQHHTHSH